MLHDIANIHVSNKEAALRAIDGPPYDGPFTRRFESKLADICQVNHVTCVSSGTGALHLGLLALGVGPGDEVILPAFSYVASPEAILHCGGRPVFCDVTGDTGLLDPTLVEQLITHRTKAVIVEHLYGHPADMVAMKQLAESSDISVIEDCAHALAATFRDQPVGGLGTIGVLSFAGKVIDTCGPGGALATNDPRIARECELLRRHGRDLVDGSRRYRPTRVGLNYLMGEIQASIGLAQADLMDSFRMRRAEIAEQYREGLADHPLLDALPVSDDVEHSYLHFVIRSQERDQLMRFLEEHEVKTRIYYEDLAYMQRAFIEAMGYSPGRFRNAEAFHGEILRLPNDMRMTDGDVDTIINRIMEWGAHSS